MFIAGSTVWMRHLWIIYAAFVLLIGRRVYEREPYDKVIYKQRLKQRTGMATANDDYQRKRTVNTVMGHAKKRNTDTNLFVVHICNERFVKWDNK